MPAPSDSQQHPGAAAAEARHHGAPPWMWHLALFMSGLGAGGATGSFATAGQLQAAVNAAEQRLAGKIELLSGKVDRGIADGVRGEQRLDRLAERVAALELENARRAGVGR